MNATIEGKAAEGLFNRHFNHPEETMKTYFAAILALAICGCGRVEDKQAPLEQHSNLSSSDALIGCYQLQGSSAWSVCIDASGNGALTAAPSGACWKVGDVVWSLITVTGTTTYSATRYNSGGEANCSAVTASSTITCSNTGCASFTETSTLANATWVRYADSVNFPCSGSYSSSGFTVSIPSGVLTAVPATDTCWSVGDSAWTGLTSTGGGWMTGTRYNPYNPKPGCPVQQQQSGPSSLQFTSSCSSFTEGGFFSATWTK